MAEYEGYCVKCREKRSFDGTVKELKNGSKAAQGECMVCGTKLTRLLPKSATPASRARDLLSARATPGRSRVSGPPRACAL